MSSGIRYLIVPGWKGSPALHWQTHWQGILPNAQRVEQRDWASPSLQEWVSELDRSIMADTRPAVLIAHSLGCITVAHWAERHGQKAGERVAGALLVAPADVERMACPEALQAFAPIPRQPLPFPSLLVGSDNDRASSAIRSLDMARDWNSHAVVLTGAGHINVESGHQRWEQGLAYLYRLQRRIDQERVQALQGRAAWRAGDALMDGFRRSA